MASMTRSAVATGFITALAFPSVTDSILSVHFALSVSLISGIGDGNGSS